jgi:palmitoyl-protein thioesterase
MWCLKVNLVFLILCAVCLQTFAHLPIVMWHGLLADPKEDFVLLKNWIRNATVEGLYIKSVDLTVNELHEQEASVFVHPNRQIELVCDEIRHDKQLANGFNAIGFSQGGQFMYKPFQLFFECKLLISQIIYRRGLIQRCRHAKVVNFISFGGQHQGIYGLPNCPNEMYSCNLLRNFLNLFAYTKWAQGSIAQATYWHDPINTALYRASSTFIADINNEHIINGDYKHRLKKLEKFVLVKFLRDEMVQPVETQWFGFYRPGSSSEIENLMESEIYRKDKLGLKQMLQEKKLVFHEIDDGHLRISHEWFSKNILIYLKE